MCFFKCIKDFFKKIKDEIIRINETTTEGDVNAWEIIEEELEGDPDFGDFLDDTNHEVITESQLEAEAASIQEIDSNVTVEEASIDIKENAPSVIDDVDAKTILMIDKDNNVVGAYNNIKEILATHPGYTYSGTYGCLKGRRQTYKGFLFQYKEDYQKINGTL